MPKTTFELFITRSDNARKQCLATLAKNYLEVRPLSPDPKWADFFHVDVDVRGSIWETAQKLASIPGVIDVDPIEKFLGLFNESTYKEDISYDPDWHRDLTYFQNGIEESVRQGRLDLQKGTNIKVAQLDTGYTDHPEIANIKKGEKIGYNYVSKGAPVDTLSQGPMYNPGHGTSTAGVFIGRRTNAPYDNVDGLFPYVHYYPYRVSESVIHIMSDTVPRAIEHAVAKDSDVIVMSMGGIPKLSWQRAVEIAFENGTIFVAAAGNHVNMFAGQQSVVWPARYDQVIAVAGVNHQGVPWEGSCYGSKVEISAPAENVRVAHVPEKDRYLYTFGSGTSFAVPHVGAAAALWLHHYAKELAKNPFKEQSSHKVEAFRYALKKSATPMSPVYQGFGAGILNVEKLLSITPQMYLNEYANPSFAARLALERSSTNSPSLEQREMMSLLLSAKITPDLDAESQLEAHIAKHGSKKGKKLFEKLQQTRMSSVLKGLERVTTASDIRGGYFELVSRGW